MKTNILKLFLGAAVAFTATACDDFLTVDPVDSLAEETFFQSENDLKLFANGMLENYLPTEDEIGLGDAYCDLVCTKTSTDYYRPGIWNTTKQGGWAISSWRNIRRANYMINNMSRCKSAVAEDIYNHYEGVARLWRAYFYYAKVQTFGDVPWVDHVLDVEDDILYAGRDDREYVMHMVLEDLNYACENCSTNATYVSGRTVINKYVALALKSRICLYEGTYRKYHKVNPSTNVAWNNQYETSTDLLNAAVDAAKELMDSGQYAIYTTGGASKAFRTVFTSTSPSATNEVIWAREMADDPLNVFNELTWRFNSDTYGQQYAPTKDLVNMFLTLDGTPIVTDQVSLTQEFDNRDYRMIQTIHGPGHTYETLAGATELKGIDWTTTATGYAFIKWSIEKEENYSKGRANNSLPILRYAEVLLNYAEATAELGQMTQDIWNKTVGALRERAGVKNIYPGGAGYTEDEFLKNYYASSPVSLSNTILEIRRERATELIMEDGLRVDDVYRWGVANLIVDRYNNNQGWRGIYVSEDEYKNGLDFNGKHYTFNASRSATSYKVGTSTADQNFSLSDGTKGYLVYNYQLEWDDKRYLRPIPSTATTLNPELGQNPGWED